MVRQHTQTHGELGSINVERALCPMCDYCALHAKMPLLLLLLLLLSSPVLHNGHNGNQHAAQF